MLTAFSQDKREYSVRELATHVGVSRPTAYRLAKALEHSGFLKFNPHNRTYRIGPTAFTVGNLFLPASFSDAVNDVLEELRAATTHTAQFAMFDGANVRLIAAKESLNLARIVARVGQLTPIHATASGKALLASLPDEEMSRLLNRDGLPRLAARTITDLDTLRADVELARKRGYATARDELADGLHAFGLLIDGTESTVRYAVVVSAPTGAVCSPKQEMELIEHLRHAADRLSAVITQYAPYIG